MYLKIESASAVHHHQYQYHHYYPAAATTITLAAKQSVVESPSPSSSQDAKIPVPLRQIGGGAAAAAQAATADGTACTPDEIFCYTQFNTSRTPNYSTHHFFQHQHHQHPGAGYPVPIPHHHHHHQQQQQQTPHHYLVNQQSAVRSRYPYPDTVAMMANYNAFESPVDVLHGPGRPDRLEQVMSLHPQYFKIFTKSYETIMKGDGPLPFHYRHYIAIMAAGRHQCSYLIEQQVSEFRLAGGDPSWLQGLQCIPTKLRDLYEINKILAHRPWLVTKDHIEKLTKGSDSWSLGEVCHALVILSHYHAISSFVFGVGIGDGEQEPPCIANASAVAVAGRGSPGSGGSALSSAGSSASSCASANALLDKQSGDEAAVAGASSSSPASGSPSVGRSVVDIGAGSKPESRTESPGRSPPPPPPPPSSQQTQLDAKSASQPGSRRSTMSNGEQTAESGLDALMRRMKSLAESRQEFSAEEQTKRYENVESQSAELAVVPDEAAATRPKPEISQFIDDPEFVYQDFARRGEPSLISTFRVQDYSWDDHAFSLLNRLYNDVGNMLDEKFRLMYALTYNFMGSKRDVDTSRFRTAIWNYIQCMFGIRHDDYDYGEVNQVLERSLKAYIKMVVCYPERVTRADYDSVLKEFHHSEKIHVNLMLLEARIQAELLYALRAVMRYMT